jgi:hypothetical protein
MMLPLLAALATVGAAVNTNTNEVSIAQSAVTVQAMEQVFARSDKAHEESMGSIMRGMSIPKAVQVLRKSSFNSPALAQVTNMALSGRGHLRKQPKGYSGIDGARKLLNDMIFESMSKYDSEIAKCTEYYAGQCAAMEACRSKISAANYVAANSRALILDSQAMINRCEVDIPTRKYELKQQNMKCAHEIQKMNTRLKIVMGDIAIMTMILEMTDCEKKLLQMKSFALLHCKDKCTHKTFIQFNHKGLQDKVDKLKGITSLGLMRSTFNDLFDGIEGLESIELVQTGRRQMPIANKTQFNNPPVPRTEVPANPCNDPNAGAPSDADKRAAKCTIKKSPQCYKLQERFLLIQAGIQDERDELMEQIAKMEEQCEEIKKTLETQIQNDEDLLESAQTKLAQATEKEANAGESARQTAAEHSQLETDLQKQMKSCSDNYINFETELCALKKIRGELYKMKGGGHSAFFQDCEVSKWDPEECSKKCAKGEQKLTRNVLTHPNGGAKCLPLAAVRSCNQQPCPVDCRLSVWSGWSKCSAECGGGVQQRLREVKLAMKFGGKPCGATSQTNACNAQACEKDCELSAWTKWSTCSKDCDGGSQKRQKFVKHEPEGAGECADEWSVKRLQYKKCNMVRCKVPDEDKPLSCNRSLDVVLLIDGSGSLGKEGWTQEIKAAQLFVDAFTDSGKANMAVIVYSGPKTWSGVEKCTGKQETPIDPEKCGIKMVTHFTEDMKKVKNLITGLDWPQGSTLTSLALMTAKAELALGRKDSKATMVVITDGRPLSFRNTAIAAKLVRKAARLVWVPVTKFAPLKHIKSWATRRWQENVVLVKEFDKLGKAETVTHIVADICPKQNPRIEIGRPSLN